MTPNEKRRYSPQFKDQAVRMVTELGKSRAEVARDLEINESTLGRWVAKEIGTLGTGSGSHKKPADPTSEDPNEMRKRIAELEMENTFLKKAAAFFAKEQR